MCLHDTDSKETSCMANLPALTDTNFDAEVLQSAQPVLVDFWAPWCGPCRMIAPIVEQLAKEHAGQLKVYKLNVDESPSLAASYGVNSIPTLMIFKGGQVVDTFIGVQPKSRLEDAITQAMA
jgi:thioredoxin 1